VQFKVINPKVEVSGKSILGMVDGLPAVKERILQILIDNNIENPQKDKWYPQQNWLDAFKTIVEVFGPNTLYVVGNKISENTKWPREFDSIEKALASIDIAFHMSHRIDDKILYDPETGTMKEGIGHYRFEKIDDKEVKMICNNSYPCDFDRGIITNTARIFVPKNSKFLRVEHDNSGLCRNNGDNQCNYIVKWF